LDTAVSLRFKRERGEGVLREYRCKNLSQRVMAWQITAQGKVH